MARTLTDALTLARPAILGDFQPDIADRAGSTAHRSTVVSIEKPPTIGELKKLDSFTQIGATLVIEPSLRKTAIHFANSQSWFLPQMWGITVITNSLRPEGDHELRFALDGFVDDFCVVNALGLSRVRNLTNESGMMPTRIPGSQDPYTFEVEILRLSPTSSVRAPIVTSGNEAYFGMMGLLNRVVTKTFARTPSTSFALAGMPRHMALNAKSEIYFILWKDLKDLFTYYGKDFFRVFNPGQSWLEFFRR
ncbi:hypothetical protein A2311_03590 [candidate division WOR-1 bacterium RIFOXYB2_FULL_48_7]|uniref:Uncharacterized protein n=1 Tax=candidate division WOR-1 bacterium RIFOXYB2_FULL_48_7 TaxID=1802583 RepID=A0A1F4TSS9_UNCSA|nr:MAG: hypothetical protein A2311_03590 [candidate division WOR-1 bacterium RIFOXYB2_FULL_48_7]